MTIWVKAKLRLKVLLRRKKMITTPFSIFRRAALCFSLVSMLVAAQSCAKEPTLDQMLKSATSGSGKERYTAIDDLGERHAHAEQVVPQLIKTLDDKDPKLSWRTARPLGEYRGQAKEAAEGIRKLLSDKD